MLKKFFSGALMALTLFNTCSLWSMQQPALLDNKLKPIAEILERGLERYEKFESTHPELAEYTLKSSMIVGKGLLFATAGAYSGAIMGSALGPVGTVTGGAVMAGEGFVTGTIMGIGHEIRGAIVKNVAGEHIEALAGKGIDRLAPQLQRLDRSLDEYDARILAASAIGATLSANEFRMVSKGLMRTAYRSLMVPRALAKKMITDPSQTLYDLARTRVSIGSMVIEPLKYGVRGRPTVAQEVIFKELSLQKPAPVNDLPPLYKEFLAEFQQQTKEILSNKGPGSIQDGIQTSRRIMELEKSSDKQLAAREIQKMCDTYQSQINYELFHATAQDLFTGCSAVLYIAGDQASARKVAGMGYAGLQLMGACHSLATGAAMPGVMGITYTSPIGPFAAIASAVAMLVSLTNTDDDNNNQLGEYLQQMHRALSQQISELHEHMMQRFDRLEEKVNILHLHLVQGFIKLSQQMRDFNAASLYSFERIESQLRALHEINAKIDGLLLQPMIKSCSEIERFHTRFGSLESMEAKEVTDHCKTLEEGLLGIHPRHEFLNGHICADFSPLGINRVLTSGTPESLLGYLAQYSQTVLAQPLPPTIQPAKLPHLGLFTLALERYLALRSKTPVAYDDQCHAIADIAHVGQHALSFIESVQRNSPLFEKLIMQYTSNFQKLLARFAEALDKKSMEVLDAVVGNAINLNKAGIETFPVCSGITTIPTNMYYNKWDKARSSHDANINSVLASRHNQMKPVLMQASALNRLIQYKDSFKLDLAASKETLLAFVDDFTLSRVVLGSGYIFPLENNQKCKIPHEAILAERLGLGIIEFSYNFDGVKTFNLTISFRKEDKTSLQLGTATLVGSNTDPTTTPEGLFARMSWPYRHFFPQFVSEFNVAVYPQKIQSCWANATLTSWNPVAQTTSILSGLIDERLLKLRKEALATLLTPTELGTQYKQSAEALESDYNVLKTFGTIAGFGASEMQPCLKLMNKTLLEKLHELCISKGLQRENPVHESQGSALASISSTVSRYTQINAIDNPFSRPLRVMLARLGQFATTHPDTVLARQFEQVKREAEKQNLALIQKAAASERESMLTQEVVHLRDSMAAMSAQMASMEALIKQLLAKSTTQ